jgi:hypothetical protein
MYSVNGPLIVTKEQKPIINVFLCNKKKKSPLQNVLPHTALSSFAMLSRRLWLPWLSGEGGSRLLHRIVRKTKIKTTTYVKY